MFDAFKADVARYKRYGYRGGVLRLLLEHQGLQAMLCYRVGNWLHRRRLPPGLRQLFSIPYFLWWKCIQATTGIYIEPHMKIAPGLFIGHYGQIIVGVKEIGRDCNLAQGVTLGYGYKNGEWGLPTLGDRVWIAAGAKILGPIKLANGTVVGANAVVTHDTEENAVVAGVPAKVLSYKGSADYIK